MLKTFVITGTVLAGLALNAPGEVRVTQFDPPLTVSAYAEAVPAPRPTSWLPLPGSQPVNVLPVDFNLDDTVDFRLAYGLGAMEAYFNAPTRFAFKTAQQVPPRPGQPIPNIVFPLAGPVGAVPLGSVIGGNIVSSVHSEYFAWSGGFTNRYDLTQPLGDHEASVILAYISPAMAPFTTGAVVSTKVVGPPYFPEASGDVVGKEGVMALEFYINGQPYYGYIQFDFRSNGAPLSGTGGLIYGWAYETEPGVPIVAAPLNVERDRFPGRNHARRPGRRPDRW